MHTLTQLPLHTICKTQTRWQIVLQHKPDDNIFYNTLQIATFYYNTRLVPPMTINWKARCWHRHKMKLVVMLDLLIFSVEIWSRNVQLYFIFQNKSNLYLSIIIRHTLFAISKPRHIAINIWSLFVNAFYHLRQIIINLWSQ